MLFQLENCKANLRLMFEQNGTYMTRLSTEMDENHGVYRGVELVTAPRGRGDQQRDQVDQFTATKQVLLENLLQNLDARFPQVDLLTAMQVRTYL